MLFDLVEIGGEKRPVRFGFNAMAMFGEMTGLKISEIERITSSMTIQNAISLVHCGLKDGARKAGKPFEYTQMDVADWLDERTQALSEILGVFVNSQARDVKKKAGNQNPK